MIKFKHFGEHENVLTAEFGYGDIGLSKAIMPAAQFATMLVLHNQPPRPIGDIAEWPNPTGMNDIHGPLIVLEFNDPRSITALIHSLTELQKDVFGHFEATHNEQH